MEFEDIRVARRWAWVMENEPQIRIEFIPREFNKAADLLSKPILGIKTIMVAWCSVVEHEIGKSTVEGILGPLKFRKCLD